MNTEYGVVLGLDVGKGNHHAVGLDPAGTRLYDGPLPNSEPALRALFTKLAVHGPLLVVVDQPATIGALPASWPASWPAPAATRWPTCPV